MPRLPAVGADRPPAPDCASRAAAAAIALAVCLALPFRGAAAATLAVSGGATIVYQQADHDASDRELTASADLVLTLPGAGGVWTLFLEGSSTAGNDGVSAFFPNANGDARSVTDSGGDGSVQVSEFHYTFDLAQSGQLVLGLIDPTVWLDISAISNDETLDFLNADFVNNPTIGFPDYTPGGAYRREAPAGWPALTLVATASAGIGDLDSRSWSDLLDVTDDGRGAFLAGEATWGDAGSRTTLGAWVRTDDRPVIDDPDETSSGYGAYAVLGRTAGDNRVDVRLGLADEDVSTIQAFAAVAWQRPLERGVLGAGLARSWLAEGVRTPDGAHATTGELYYRLPIGGDAGHIAPSIQYVENAASESGTGDHKRDALVVGVRFGWVFAN